MNALDINDDFDIDEDMEDLVSAEDFLNYFDIPFDETTINVYRLHILQRYHDYLSQAELAEDQAERREQYKQILIQAYTSFIDSGSNGLFFLDYATLGIPDCSDNPGWYCPGSPLTYTVTNTGQNGTSNPVSFDIANADSLFAINNGQNSAFNNLGGDSGTDPSTDYFDFGVPFFYGRNVFVGIENMSGPNGIVGPYWAY